MPIIASYTWTEKKDTIKVAVPLKGVSANKADVLVSATTLKVNFSPYLLDIVLLKEIDELKHKASVKDGVLQITLCKKESGLWGSLIATGSKEDLVAAKLVAATQQEQLNQTLAEQRHERKLAEEKHSLRKQMKLEELERTRVENMKQEEKETAEKEVYEAFAQMNMKDNAKKQQKSDNIVKEKKTISFQNNENNNINTVDSYLLADDIDDDNNNNNNEIVAQKSTYEMNDIEDSDEENMKPETSTSSNIFIENERDEDYIHEEEVRYIPPPRYMGNNGTTEADSKINVSFTPRVFPTPMRESKAAEEEDWVAKNRRHIKNHGVLGKGLSKDISEEDPVWLKAKGDDFLRSGDLRSALNAYTAALECDPNLISCLANRSVCYLRSNQSNECIHDCNTVLTLLSKETDPIVINKNKSMIVKVIMRRGTAYCQLGKYIEALSDYHQVRVKYEQLNVSQISALHGVNMNTLNADIIRLKLLSDTDVLKKEGDNLMSEGNIQLALSKYTAALAFIPVHVSCLSNRSACYFALKDFKSCIEDCNTAITLLRIDDTSISTINTNVLTTSNDSIVLPQDQLKTMLLNILPPVGTAKRSSWLVKTLLRRGVAHSQCGLWEQAVQDYTDAAAMDPRNTAIQVDLQQLISARDAAASTTTATIDNAADATTTTADVSCAASTAATTVSE